KQLPQIWYQIQTKFRDEPRPKSGLLRVRQFIMKDAYSFDINEAGLDKSFDLHDAAYRAIFTRCGLKFVAVEADSGAMGGSQSQEFMVYTDAGEDFIASCPVCGYAANLEKATSRLDPVVELAPTGDGMPEPIHTPGMGAIADIAVFLKMSPANDIKCVALMGQIPEIQGVEPSSAGGTSLPTAVFLRGDHQVNETKLISCLNEYQRSRGPATRTVSDLRPMHEEELQRYFNAPAGYLGPIGLENAMRAGLVVIVDKALEGRRNMVCGANKLDYHFRNVTPDRDFKWNISADIRSVNAGEGCPSKYHPVPGSENKVVYPFRPDGYCAGSLVVGKAVEVGHIFKLGYKYSESMGARVLDENGKEVTPIMGSYGIGIERILTAAIEQANDANGFCLAASIAPFTVAVTVTNVGDAALRETGEKLA